jgi:TonB family protein
LNQYVGEQVVIANNFNYSLIKNRIKMISKIKSKKITQVKFFVGFILAASLVAVFACEQKESVQTEVTSNEKSVTIIAEGHSLQITGDAAGIEKLKKAISGSEDYELKSDSGTGQLILASKTNRVGEVVAVSLRSQEKSAQIQEEVFFEVEEMPEFPGGQLELRKFIAQTIKYPVIAQKNGIQGKVFVSFVVNKDGSVSNAQITRGVDPSLNAEALRVVMSLPAFKPGKQKGNVVAVQYTIPINFVLQ